MVDWCFREFMAQNNVLQGITGNWFLLHCMAFYLCSAQTLWIPHKCKFYLLSDELLQWEESRQKCISAGGALVTIDSEEEQVRDIL